jgi:hypothetical protein
MFKKFDGFNSRFKRPGDEKDSQNNQNKDKIDNKIKDKDSEQNNIKFNSSLKWPVFKDINDSKIE